MSSVSSMINKFGGAKPGSNESVSEQYAKKKVPGSPTSKSDSSSVKVGTKPVDPEESMQKESLPANKGTPSTPKIRKTSIKASELGIDLTDISSETLNEAVKKWKSEQKAAKSEPGKERTRSRSKSRGRSDGDTNTTTSRSRSKSRSRNSNDNTNDTTSTPRTIKKKIIVRRRASFKTPTTEKLERAPPARQSSKDDMSDIMQGQKSVPMAPDLSGESTPQPSEDLQSPMSASETKAFVSAEKCVEAVLDSVPLSPKRFVRRTEKVTGSEDAVQQQQRSTSRSRMAKARSDAAEIQKRLTEAGITDEQYRAMLKAGLSISLT